MTDNIDSAFVEIAASAPDVALAAERLVPLYEDLAEDPPPAPVSSSRLRRASWVVFVTSVVLWLVAGVYLLIRVAVWLGQHGMLPAPN